MKFTILPASQLSADLIQVWRQLQFLNPHLSSPYFCPEFTLAAAAVRNDVKVAVIEENGKAVAFFPWQRGKAGAGAAVGGRLSDYHGVICAPQFNCDPAVLLKACSLPAWDFDHLIAAQPVFAAFHRKAAASPFIDLSDGFDAWRAKCNAVRTEQITIRRLQRGLGGIRLETHCGNPEMLRQILSWKSAQYRRTGRKRGFDREAIALIDEIYRTQTPYFSGMLSVLYAGDMPVAGHFGMRCRGELHWWFPAYAYEHARYSPGTVLLIKMAEAANSIGIRRIDLGKGLALYKDRFKSGETALAEGSAELPSLLKLRRRLRHFGRNTERTIKAASTRVSSLAAGAAAVIRKMGEREVVKVDG
jgi:CelD/BcsL family acetyltransferase involved in cellulose biosynthesis